MGSAPANTGAGRDRTGAGSNDRVGETTRSRNETALARNCDRRDSATQRLFDVDVASANDLDPLIVELETQRPVIFQSGEATGDNFIGADVNAEAGPGKVRALLPG